MAKLKEKKYYVVWVGRKPGVYDNWAACKAQVDKQTGAKYKSFVTESEATQAYADGWQQHVHPSAATLKREHELLTANPPVQEALAVDAACSGNPGVMEYRGVLVQNRQEIFHMKFPEGTNNIGEFLAIVHGLSVLKQKNCPWLIYSDSKIAISWVSQKQCKTKLQPNAKNAALLDMVRRAEAWLRANTYTTEIRKWLTPVWGEIPADFGRK